MAEVFFTSFCDLLLVMRKASLYTLISGLRKSPDKKATVQIVEYLK